MVALSPLYHKGELVYTDLEPLIFEEWTLGEDINAQRRILLDRAAIALNSQVVATKLRAVSDNGTLELQLANGKSALLRSPTVKREDTPLAKWTRRKFEAETSILQWLNSVAKLVVPSILFLDPDDGMVISSFLPGLDAAHAYPHLSTAAKEASVTSYAAAFLPIFRLEVPQRFGSACGWESSPSPSLRIGSFISLTVDHSFDVSSDDDLHAFFDRLIQSRRDRSLREEDADAHALVCSRLSRLSDGIRPLIEKIYEQPSMSRFALSHDDTRPNNILLDPVSGQVTGIVDWEYHSCLPAALAVGYPSWIVPSPREDLRYRSPKTLFQVYLLEGPTESERLKMLYENTVKELDEDYWYCLIHGAKLRGALRWLIEVGKLEDPSGEGMSNWTEKELYGKI